MSERIGNVTLERFEELVAKANELVKQVTWAQFDLGDIGVVAAATSAPGASRTASTVAVHEVRPASSAATTE
ncbi:hypothetical protein [Streptomyces morookaense]|uniref:Uncharacterized protein n=1 Tax=Streptomyces morookaense TaxID=1970 RepID=A0A7Y7E9C2_STRMO|nr:hypothetical protein [Streptomyces morookaense]NVK80266.1 hypothetical protein [Streptomyces morookaense]GHF40133.1 hypothetical protein GCM10010359_48370 [Streptomyces morookaense]